MAADQTGCFYVSETLVILMSNFPLRICDSVTLALDSLVHVGNVGPRGLRPRQPAHADQQTHHGIAALDVQLHITLDAAQMFKLERKFSSVARSEKDS